MGTTEQIGLAEDWARRFDSVGVQLRGFHKRKDGSCVLHVNQAGAIRRLEVQELKREIEARLSLVRVGPENTGDEIADSRAELEAKVEGERLAEQLRLLPKFSGHWRAGALPPIWEASGAVAVPQGRGKEQGPSCVVSLAVARKDVGDLVEKNPGSATVQICGEYLLSHQIANRPGYTADKLANLISHHNNKARNKVIPKR
jgi:hypothetical protein